MKKNLPGLTGNLIASLFIFLPIILLRLIWVSSGIIMDIAVLAAVGTLIALWLIWALSLLPDSTAEPSADEKRKRSASDQDARLSLLLQLMGDDERQALKQRLMEDLSSDGEAVSLAQLLSAAQDHSDQSDTD